MVGLYDNWWSNMISPSETPQQTIKTYSVGGLRSATRQRLPRQAFGLKRLRVGDDGGPRTSAAAVPLCDCGAILEAAVGALVTSSPNKQRDAAGDRSRGREGGRRAAEQSKEKAVRVGQRLDRHLLFNSIVYSC